MSHKVAFTDEDDALLMKYIATYNPQPKGRLGMKLYERLVENEERKWSFASHHPVHSWRERYKTNQQRFDAQILKYQKKHEISADPPYIPSSQASGRRDVRKNLTTSPVSRARAIRVSAAPVGENGTKKRPREVDSRDENLDSGIIKKMRRENVVVQVKQPCDSPPHTRPPSVELRNRRKTRVESLHPPSPKEDEEAPAIGADDYIGALSDRGEDDQDAECRSEGSRASASARSSRSSSPANEGAIKPPAAPSKSPSPSHLGAAPAPEEPSPSRQLQETPLGNSSHHDATVTRSPAQAVVAEASRSMLRTVDAPLQLSQEPTPPHTSAINSPSSPLQRQLSPPSDTSLQPGIVPRHSPSTRPNQRRISPSPRKRSTARVEDDGIFGTPPPQRVRKSPPRRARVRGAPRLVEGPFRSLYSNADGESRFTLRPPASGMGEEVEDGSQDEEWPPRRDKRKPQISSSEGQQFITNVPSHVRSEQLRQPKAIQASEAVPVDKSTLIAKAMSATEPAINNKNANRSALAISRREDIPLPVAQVAAAPVDKASNIARGPLQPNATASSSRSRLPSDPGRHASPHDSSHTTTGGRPTAAKARLKSVPVRELTEAKGQTPIIDRNRLLFPAISAHELPPPAPGPPSKRVARGQYPSPDAQYDSPTDDPFTVPLVNRGARRRTIGDARGVPQVDFRSEGHARRASVQHIDLRVLHSGKSAGLSRTGSSMSRSSSVAQKKRPRKPPRLTTSSNLSESNKELVLALGLEAVYARMAENHKFHIDIVREVATRQRSLEDADRVLRHMREAAGREFARLLMQEGTVHGIVEDETEESEDEEEGAADKSGGDDNHQYLGSNSTRVLPQGRARRAALKITTESPNSSPTRPPHYSPPTPTRAHEFRRLERQGRVEEARLREARRVRRSLQLNSAEASPEVDERRIVAYLLQQQKHCSNAVLPEEHWNVNGVVRGEQDGEDEMKEGQEGGGLSISPKSEDEHADSDARQFQGSELAEEDEALADTTIELGYDPGTLDNSQGHHPPNSPGQDSHEGHETVDAEDEPNGTAAMVNTVLLGAMSDEEAAEVEEQVVADVRSQTSSGFRLVQPEPGLHAEFPDLDANKGADFTNEHQVSEDVFVEGNRSCDLVQELDGEYTKQADSSCLPGPPLATSPLPDMTWTNSDDELLLDGDLTVHEELVRRKGLISVKFRIAHLYGLMLDA